MIAGSIFAQGEARRSRWLQIKKLHDVDESTISMTFVEGMKPFVFPLVRQKCDRIVGSCFNGLTSIYPAIQVVDESDGVGGNVSDIERAIENLSRIAGRNKAIKQAARTAFITNRSVWLIYPEVSDVDEAADDGTKTKAPHVSGLCWKNIHPENVAVFPPTVASWKEAQLIGHRRFEQYWTVRGKMKRGEYFFEESVQGGDDPNAHEQREKETKQKGKKPPEVTPATRVVEEWECIVWVDLDSLDGPEEDGDGDYDCFLVTIAYQSGKVLKIEPYPYVDPYMPWYIPVSLVEDCEDKVWPDDSVGQTVQQQQIGANDYATIIGQGAAMSAAVPVFVSGGALLDKKAEKYEVATIYYLDGDAKVQAFPSAFNPSNLFTFLEMLEVNIDSLTGIQRASAEATPDRETATSANMRMQAQTEAKDNYSDQMAAALEDAGKLIFSLIKYHFGDFKKAFGSQLPIRDGLYQPPGYATDPQTGQPALDPDGNPMPNPPQVIPAPMRMAMMSPRFEVTGRSGTNSPQILVAKLQQALQLAMARGSEFDPLKIANRIMYALELPFSVDGLKKSPEQMQNEQMQAESEPPPGMREQVRVMLADLGPTEHAQFVQKYMGLTPDDPANMPQGYGAQSQQMLIHAVQGLVDGSVKPQTAMMLVEHLMQMAHHGASNVPKMMEQEQGGGPEA